MRPLLLFTPIYSYTAEAFVNKLLEVDANEDQEYWINSPGGSVFAGYSILGALQERTGKNNAKVFGSADSMLAYMLLFMDNVEALDTSTFRLHRADGYVDNDQDKAFLAKVNKDLRAKMEKKINSEIFKEVTGHTFNEMFDPSKRIDIDLDAKQAKKIGLINKIIRLEPTQIAAMSERLIAFADFQEPQGSGIEEKKPQGSGEKQEQNNNNQKTIKMTKEEFKAQNPEVFSQIYNEGVEAGASKEKDRVEAFLEFVEIDPETVKAQISENKAVTSKFMAEMTKKFMAQSHKEKLTAEATEEIVTPDEPKTKEKTELDAFAASMDAEMGLKTKEV